MCIKKARAETAQAFCGSVPALPAICCQLFVVAQGLHDGKHFFKVDESAAVLQLVLIDCHGKLTCIWREVFVAIGKLASFAAIRSRVGYFSAFDKRCVSNRRRRV